MKLSEFTRCLLRRANPAKMRALLTMGLLCLTAAPSALADPRAATTSNEARKEALAALPLAVMAESDRAAVGYVLQNTSVFRRMPTEVVECDPDLMTFLLENPEVLTNIWQLMKISDVRLQRTGPTTFRADDGLGTVADIKIVYSSPTKYVLYCEGGYHGSLLARPVRGRCVLMLRMQGLEENDGRHYVTCRLDTFLHMERAGFELLAKTVHPLMGRAADSNFTETLAFVGHLSRTCAMNPAGTARMAQLLTHVPPKTRTQLGLLAYEIAKRSEPMTAVVPTQHQAVANRPPTRQPVTEPARE